MNINIKKLSEENVKICTNIICNSVLGEKYGYEKEKINEMLLNAIKKEEKIYTAHIKEDVVGVVWYDLKGAFCIAPYLRLIIVDKKYKGMNIGSYLIDFYEKQCVKENKHYFLLVSDFNSKAIKFYETKGYIRIGIILSFVKKNINEIIMMKENKRNLS